MAKKKEALTDKQVAQLLDAVRGLPPYVFIMIGLYSGLRREEALALQSVRPQSGQARAPVFQALIFTPKYQEPPETDVSGGFLFRKH